MKKFLIAAIFLLASFAPLNAVVINKFLLGTYCIAHSIPVKKKVWEIPDKKDPLVPEGDILDLAESKYYYVEPEIKKHELLYYLKWITWAARSKKVEYIWIG